MGVRVFLAPAAAGGAFLFLLLRGNSQKQDLKTEINLKNEQTSKLQNELQNLNISKQTLYYKRS